MNPLVKYFAVLSLLGGCASHEITPAAALEPSYLPSPNVIVNISGLGPCTDSPDRSLRLDSSQPVNVLVHGCYGSSGQFRSLAQVLAFHGQQAACFTYDDRAKLTHSASELALALKQLAEQTRVPQITVIGHSQGALIARNSLTTSQLIARPVLPANLRLVTISGPFAGIESARTCGKGWLYPLTLGFIPLSCYLATGPKWTDITYSSSFIREPGALAPQVVNYLKIDTDERNTCRREVDGRCVASDDIFSLAEQRNSSVEAGPRITRVEVKAGHVEIVGDERGPPTKLIGILQDEGILNPTAKQQTSAFQLLLSRLYPDTGLHTHSHP